MSTANTLVPGQTYYIRVYTFTATPNQTTTFTVCVGTPVQCIDSLPFCGATGLQYPSTVGSPSLGQIGCLFTTPNPAFFYLQVENSGPLNFQIAQTNTAGAGIDVDFIAYGPFTSVANACGNLNAGTTVACSYSAAAIENFTIPNAINGQIYVVMITNFNGSAGTVTFNQTNNTTTGSGSTNCDIVCSVNLGPDQVVCDATTYTITSTNQGADSYSWFFNGSTTPIPGETSSTLVVTQSGDYKCKIICGLNDAEDTVNINFTSITAQELPDVNSCDNYVLPSLNANNSYYTGPGGTGNVLNAGDIITTTQEIYVYAQTTTTPSCTDETSFIVTITTTPTPDAPTDVTVCDSYVLPALTNGNYFTGSNGTGQQLNAGDVINTTQILYVYQQTATTPNCFAQNSFTVTVNSITAQTLNNVTACDSYTLQPLNANNSYYTSTGGTGTLLTAGTVISTSQTIFIYAQSTTTPVCTDETSFVVTINTTPSLSAIANVDACDSYVLPALTLGNYFTQPGGLGTQLAFNSTVQTSQTIYVYTSVGTAPNVCFDEVSFNVNIINSPEFEINGGCEGTIYVLEALPLNNSYNPDTASFSWTDENGIILGNSSSINVSQNGNYTCTITTNNGTTCSTSVTFNANETTCTIQKGISPNGDGLNDAFELTGLGVKELGIYNRYGAKVYSKTNYTNQWVGQSDNGNDLPDGTYYFVIDRIQGESKSGWIYINREN